MTNDGRGPMPLDGVRVIDLTHYTAGPFATRLLADYGADVIKIEPRSGDPCRALPPFFQDKPGPDRSGLFLFLNTGKRSVVLDLKTKEGQARLLDLARGAEVLIESFSPGTMDRLGLGFDVLHEANPRLVVTSLSNFGQDGPYVDYAGTDLTLFALGGPMIAGGDADHEPLKNAGRMTTYQGGYVAALATAVGLRAAERRGEGEHLDVSIFEAATQSIDLRLSRLLMYQYNGGWGGRPTLISGIGSGIFPCADGFFQITSGTARLERTMRMIGRDDLIDDPAWGLAEREKPDRVTEFRILMIPWILERTKAELLAACIEHGVLGAPINTVEDLLNDVNFRERQYFQEIDHPQTGPLTYPGYHFTLHRREGPMPARRRAPLLGEHTEEVLGELAAAQARPPKTPVVAAARRERPLEGLRIVDLTVVLAGPYATMQLADWGAEVIRVESTHYFPTSTRGPLARPPQTVIDASEQNHAGFGWVDNEPGARPWNRVAPFNHHSRGKRSVTVDLRRPEGFAVLERLVAMSDGLMENNVPESMEKLGITWERLSAINPNLVMVRMPGFGLTGPYRGLRTMGMQMEALAGHPAIRTYPGLSYEYVPLGVPSDASGGVGAAFAFLTGLRYRERTGHGVLVEAATTENFVPLISEFIMDYTMNGRVAPQMGNDHFWLAPHNVYPCRGADRWVTIACRSDDEWRRLATLIHRPGLADDERFATMTARYANRAELDPIISEWTSTLESRWVFHRLQQEGIAAGAVYPEPDVFEDRHLRARGLFQTLTHPEAGTHEHVGPAWRANGSRPKIWRHAPRLGEDNEYVYRELLGFSDDEYRRFEEIGHIGTDFDPDIR